MKSKIPGPENQEKHIFLEKAVNTMMVNFVCHGLRGDYEAWKMFFVHLFWELSFCYFWKKFLCGWGELNKGDLPSPTWVHICPLIEVLNRNFWGWIDSLSPLDLVCLLSPPLGHQYSWLLAFMLRLRFTSLGPLAQRPWVWPRTEVPAWG
jgi:hypothetical protein